MNKQSSKAGLPTAMCGKCLLAMAILASAWGCKRGGLIDPNAGLDEDQKAIQGLMYSLADSTNDLDAFRAMFAADKAPPSADRTKYKEYMFFVVGDIAVTGDTANFTAGLETQVGEAEPTVAEKPWTAVKEADGWKLNDAPLP